MGWAVVGRTLDATAVAATSAMAGSILVADLWVGIDATEKRILRSLKEKSDVKSLTMSS